ncbi:NADH dehydrogenase [ubiquinone] 1 alpha subcomplex subunit 2 [Zootermopsis nevadensis]|uniref:NADH dehydrogenase [ubiquinone] 1 alpha subcomplex subunit 2 n=1 Tax=Zootermopsis nevadensis TaxID=136037 RepID=A0A067QHD3_ZOONE|nr:NADH dehydrogenase [ubiquinone] 1 alpha subcomplex subunit 2 [Zootermopsis nevadensis]
MASRLALQLSKDLKELRLHLCQTSAASRGVRDFIETYYVNLKRSNPKFPILIRECSGVQPRLYARYGKDETHDI